MIRCHKMWYGTTKTQFLASISLRTLLLLCYMSVSGMALTWHFCGGWVLQKIDINLLVLLEAFWLCLSLGLFQILTIFLKRIKTYFLTFLKRIFQGFWPQVQNSYFVEHLSMVASDNTLGEKQYFQKFWSPQKNLFTRLFIPFLKY